MGYILMQSNDSPASIATLLHLHKRDAYLFDSSPKWPRLHPINVYSRTNLPFEENYYSFVGEVACGRWGIIMHQRDLGGAYSLCDYLLVKGILYYNEPIHQIHRWAKEVLGFDFAVEH